MNRRTFLKQASVVTAATVIAPSLVSCGNSPKTIGLQVYTIREEMKSDLEGAPKKVAQIGYNSIEAAGYADGKFYGKSPEEFKKQISDLGMELNSSHTSLFDVESAKKAAEDGAKAGLKYLICPWMPKEHRQSADSILALAETFNKIGEVCKASGIQFGYHNHDFEFVKFGDELIFDMLLKNTDPSLVTYELDIYWIKKGGYNAIDYFKKYPGRFGLWHVKDMADSEKEEFAPVGEGKFDFAEIFKHKDEAGMKYYFVEQDSFTKHTPFESIEISHKFMTNLAYRPQK